MNTTNTRRSDVEKVVAQVMYGLDNVVAENMARHQFEDSLRQVLTSFAEKAVAEEGKRLFNIALTKGWAELERTFKALTPPKETNK